MLSLVSTVTGQSDAVSSMEPSNPSGFVIHRGVNLSHWLSQNFGWAPREHWITENDIEFIARSGFDHVRLPVDEKELWAENGNPSEESFALLEKALGWCRENNLRVILDLHTVRAHHFNAPNEGGHNTLWENPEAQSHFISIWNDLSRRFHSFPNDFLAYEIMNEPTAEDPEDWNKLVAMTVKEIRSQEPGRVIVIGSNRWQSPSTFPQLKVPEGDKNLILSMHTYAPMFLTHYTADWVSEPLLSYRGPVSYPGPVVPDAEREKILSSCNPDLKAVLADSLGVWNADRLRSTIEPAIKKAKELGLQLYCGEFGCLPVAPRDSRLAYYRDIVGIFESEGVAWANWEYKGDFGILEWFNVDNQLITGAPDEKMIDALMQR